MNPPLADLRFFLGGRDLEMVTIRELLERHVPGQVLDHGLSWGAKASAYSVPIRESLAASQTVVLVELQDDLGLLTGPDVTRVVNVDHHGDLAGQDRPTALEQVFQLLGLPPDAWTRWQALVAANDRGHVAAMRKLDATREEIVQVRAADRAAQGITPEQEAVGRLAAARAERFHDGWLTVVELPHQHTATVTDALQPELGGPGYRNLLVFCPANVIFFGEGSAIASLRDAFPGGFWGGELPAHGFWGLSERLLRTVVLSTLGIAETNTMRKASEVKVHAFRQILIWPLLIKSRSGLRDRIDVGETDESDDDGLSGAADQLKQTIDLFIRPTAHGASPWRLVETLPERTTPVDDFASHPPTLSSEPTYEEIVYFHPFVRDFLFGDGPRSTSDASALRCLRRDDVRHVRITDAQNDTVDLNVDRVELYLCKPLVALLVVEIATPSDAAPITLETALALQSQLRQVYPPYFYEKNGADGKCVTKDVPGNCPRHVQWYASPPSGPLATSDFDAGRERFADFSHRGAEPPVGRHWQYLLQPLRPYASGQESELETSIQYYQQIVDDRIPGMTYLAVDDPRTISDGDYDRLTFCDVTGTAPYPFASEFLEPRRHRHVYDRFWRRSPSQDGPYLELSTRFLCSGYQFVIVGRYQNEFFQTIIPQHFRRQYFRMGLIVHFHRAALLKFADELSDAIKVLRGIHHDRELVTPAFRRAVTRLQQTFLKFRSRCWFTEVSNQLQGAELFDWWRGLLRNEQLFRDVDESCQQLYGVLTEQDSRRLARSQEMLAHGGALIGVIGLILMAIQAYFAAFGNQGISSSSTLAPAARVAPADPGRSNAIRQTDIGPVRGDARIDSVPK